MAKTATTSGKIVQVISAVVDVDFSAAELPEINTALEVDYELYGSQTTLVLEIQSHLGGGWVRTVAMFGRAGCS